ncbi:hypothetical protein [Streptomyces violascens]|uniref:hypothetical protein n=1 Tax=Streptomyces violascens TaxID=67381 RepID=UPI0016750217|nr:hypothetical protein [Streptomyces violascens]GGU48678.1 hypothetical protein GCM10010289_81470 [Streptomyces violascens]
MGWFKNWGHQQMRKGAIAARERGDATYVHTLAASAEQIQQRYITAIESEGWKLTSRHENPATPRQRWTLTFERAEVTSPS